MEVDRAVAVDGLGIGIAIAFEAVLFLPHDSVHFLGISGGGDELLDLNLQHEVHLFELGVQVFILRHLLPEIAR